MISYRKQLNKTRVSLKIDVVDNIGNTKAGDEIFFPSAPATKHKGGDVPDREDTSGLSDTRLLLNTTDSLLEEGRDLGRRSLGLSSVVADLVADNGDSRASLEKRRKICQRHARKTVPK